ncbi:MAG: heavy metal-associated domain-containing protein [Lachnospiraceae bacterium]
MTTLKVADMHCEKCVARISNALTEAGISFSVDLAAKTVAVESSKVDTAISELDDLGFDAIV